MNSSALGRIRHLSGTPPASAAPCPHPRALRRHRRWPPLSCPRPAALPTRLYPPTDLARCRIGVLPYSSDRRESHGGATDGVLRLPRAAGDAVPGRHSIRAEPPVFLVCTWSPCPRALSPGALRGGCRRVSVPLHGSILAGRRASSTSGTPACSSCSSSSVSSPSYQQVRSRRSPPWICAVCS